MEAEPELLGEGKALADQNKDTPVVPGSEVLDGKKIIGRRERIVRDNVAFGCKLPIDVPQLAEDLTEDAIKRLKANTKMLLTDSMRR